MIISLNFPERIGAFLIFAEIKSGPRAFMNMLKNAKETVEVKDEEAEEYGVVNRVGGGIDWKRSTAGKEKEFELTESAHAYLKTRLEQIDKGDMPIDLLDIANKILGEDEKNG